MNREQFVNRIIEKIEKDNILPWVCTWKKYTNGDNLPCNFITKKHYRGINAFWLMIMPYSSPYWLSYKQAKELGGNVKKGEKATPVVYYSTFEVEENEKKKEVPFLKTYPMFNIEQCEGIETPELIPLELNDNQIIDNCEEIIKNFKDIPQFEISISNRAYYVPSKDLIKMPSINQFDCPESYYGTFFHELGHSTGHESRLNRSELKESHHFGDENYSKEELIAEMTACFLCAEAGIENTTFDNSVSYINGWLKVLKKNPNWLLQSASSAQKAADYILQKK